MQYRDKFRFIVVYRVLLREILALSTICRTKDDILNFKEKIKNTN